MSLPIDSNKDIRGNDIFYVVKAFFQYLIKKYLLMALFLLIGATCGLLFYFLIQKSKYNGQTSFILEDKSPGSGGLSSIASQFGIDVGGNSSGSIMAGDNILEILRSRNIVEKVLLSDIKIDNQSISLIQLFIEQERFKEKWVKKSWYSEPLYKQGLTRNSLSKIQDSLLQLVGKYIVKNNLTIERASKKSTVFYVDVITKNHLFSKFFSERVVSASLEYYINIKTNNAKITVEKLERKADSLLLLLNIKSYAAAQTKVIDGNPALGVPYVPNELLNRDKAVIGTVYGEVVKNLETAKFTLTQQTPIIQILDAPTFPLTALRKGKLLCLFIGLFISGLVGIAIIVLGFIKKYTSNQI